MQYSAEEEDIMLAYLMRVYTHKIPALGLETVQSFVEILQNIVSYLSEHQTSLGRFLSIHLVLAIGMTLDIPALKGVKELIKSTRTFAESTNNHIMLLFLTQYEEFMASNSANN